MPQIQKSKGRARHDPLHVELHEDETQAKFGKISEPGKRKKSRRTNEDQNDSIETALDSKTSQKIFELAKTQQLEIEEEDDPLQDEDSSDNPDRSNFRTPRISAFDDEEDDQGIDYDVAEDPGNPEEEFNIDLNDRAALDNLHPANVGERKTLADVIFAQLNNASPEIRTVRIAGPQAEPEAPDPAAGLDPRIVETYTKIALLLQRHRSGPLPKVFKVIPSFPAWARILALTQPESWSPHACRAATKIFISSMKPPQAQLFIRVQGCTLKEAAIIASVLARKKIPVLHASAALLRIAEMDYTGPNSLFIRVLLDKKMQLPYKVVDALVFHFIRLSNTYKARTRGDSEKLPVLWHQSLLVFTQRYASDLTPDQKDALLDVVKATSHPQISPEIRRELVQSVVRGAPRQEDVEMS
ncbi:Bystin-domain-containing protein [Flagelloscypha sp. PMI_526]|nr:Bystin-domain-containing protein [Flagelloscypha sp. PMI_526]